MSQSPPPETNDDFRYETVARFINELIDQGALTPGEKAPSLRKVSQAQGVSVTTALHAYRVLESRGVLQAQPQSGFYVRSKTRHGAETPAKVVPTQRSREVTSGERVATMFELAGNTDFIPFGCATPSPDLLAASQLDKFLARAARVRGKASNTYAPPSGYDDLRTSIARRSMLYGHAVSAQDIVITNGCTEALHLALKSVTKPGDTIAVESPTYFGFLPILQSLHLNVAELPTDAVTGLCIDSLKLMLEKKTITACLFSSAFNNPLGCLISESNKSKVLRLLNKYKVPLIEDDIYGDIYFGRDRPRPYSALKGARNVIYCSSFSKTVAPGYRLGWIACPSHRDDVLAQKYATTLCNPFLTQIAMAEFLNGGAYDNHLRSLRRALSNNVARMTQAIQESFPPGTRISRPAGGFVLWVELAKRSNSVNDTRALFDAAMQKSICFAPGDLFTTTNEYKQCLRISCGYPWNSTLQHAIWKLGQLAHSI